MNEKFIHAIADGDMSGDINGTVIDCANICLAAIHSVWSGTPAGNIIIQASCAEEDPGSTGDWVAIDTNAAGGAAGTDLVNIADLGYRWIRVFYDSTSSTGTLNTYVQIKG